LNLDEQLLSLSVVYILHKLSYRGPNQQLPIVGQNQQRNKTILGTKFFTSLKLFACRLNPCIATCEPSSQINIIVTFFIAWKSDNEGETQGKIWEMDKRQRCTPTEEFGINT
jgi:hypothetical protein